MIDNVTKCGIDGIPRCAAGWDEVPCIGDTIGPQAGFGGGGTNGS